MDSFVQEFRRVGRDDKTYMALLLFHCKQCKNRDNDMKKLTLPIQINFEKIAY